MATYTQEQIEEVVRMINAGEITIQQLEQQYGVPAAEIQMNLDAINGGQAAAETYTAPERLFDPNLLDIFQDTTIDNTLNTPSAPSTVTYETTTTPNLDLNPFIPAGETVVNDFTGMNEFAPQIPVETDDNEGASVAVDQKLASLSSALNDILTSGASVSAVVQAVADLLRTTGTSSDAVAQITGENVGDINRELAKEGYGPAGDFNPAYQDYSEDHPSFNRTGTGTGFDQYGLTAKNVPTNQTTTTAGGGSELPDLSDDTASSEPTTGSSTQTPQDSGDMTPAQREHPWRYDGNGTFTNVITGEVGTAAIPDGVVFVEGDHYSVGNSGEVFNSENNQVAAVEQNADGIDVFVGLGGIGGAGNNTNNGTDAGAGGGGGTATPTTTTTPSGGGGTTTTTTTPTTPGGGGGTGGGTGTGDGPGNGGGTTNNIAVVTAPATPITDGMFADYAPKFRRQIGRNLLNPNFRS